MKAVFSLNYELTRVKVIFCDSVFNTLNFYDTWKGNKTSILFLNSRVKPLEKLNWGPILVLHHKSSELCPDHNTSIPSRTTYRNISISLRGSKALRYLSLNICSASDTLNDVATLESFPLSRCIVPSSLGSKTFSNSSLLMCPLFSLRDDTPVLPYSKPSSNSFEIVALFGTLDLVDLSL